MLRAALMNGSRVWSPAVPPSVQQRQGSYQTGTAYQPPLASTTEAPPWGLFATPWGLFASFSVSATTACCQSCSSKRSFDCLGRSLPELSAGQFVSGLGQSFVYFVC